MKDVELVTNIGGVYLFSVSTSQQDGWIETLAMLEKQGVGDFGHRISEGFGQIRVCDEFHSVFREHAV